MPPSSARLQPLAALTEGRARRITGVLCDIDDTLTWHGELVPEAFLALHRARAAGLLVVPITGRPGGWVDHLARTWPVDGVVGENGGLWFYRDGGRMERRFLQSPSERAANRERLTNLGAEILAAVPGAALASDQPYRDLDLAIDFCEDVPPLGEAAIDQIVALFERAGATCKVSSIHVNGWFGEFDKLTGCARLLDERWGQPLAEAQQTWAFVGDSANDEPMFRAFELSVGVANVARFVPRMNALPAFVCERVGGWGFAEFIDRLLELRGWSPDDSPRR
jgi:HAD superfamily hydrolase (TIGR01484 family)